MTDTGWLAECCAVLNHGEVVAYPTEAVWGLGSDPWDEQAVRQILAIKGRPQEKGLILVAADTAQLEPLLRHLSDEQKALLDQTWPGPVTWLIPDPDNWIPRWVKGEHSSVAVRVSGHDQVRALCAAFGKPIVSTSANRAGEEALRTRADVIAEFGGELGMVTPGEVGGATNPSQIRDLATGAILR